MELRRVRFRSRVGHLRVDPSARRHHRRAHRRRHRRDPAKHPGGARARIAPRAEGARCRPTHRRTLVNRPILRAGDWIRLSAERFPDRRAIVFHDGSARTYAEINSRVKRLASALTRHGVAKGDRVAILALDGGGYLETILATMTLGAVYVPINYKLAPDRKSTRLNSSH